ncbi:MAG: hypothetical protein M3198_14610 [Actinomycetota bacterium]|nr:hypothetical protein [Actinomycetota bacterium]
MRQLHIRDAWADLAYNSGSQLLEDLASRVQMLETRVRELEIKLADSDQDRELKIDLADAEQNREPVTAGV